MKNKKGLIAIIIILIISCSVINSSHKEKQFNNYMSQADKLISEKKYDEAKKQLDSAKNIKDTDAVKEKQKLINFNQDQLKIYNESLDLIKKEDYDSALKKLSEIDKKAEDVKKNADEQIVICKQKLIPIKIDEAKNFLDSKEFDKAYSKINEAVSIDGNNKQVLDFKNSINTKKTAYEEEQKQIAVAKKEEEERINKEKAIEDEIAKQEQAREEQGTQQVLSNNVSDGTHVYWTPKGKSYHSSPGCPTLSRSKTIYEGSIQESGKFDPCDRCM
ncbi:hypothetical protein [Clostridium senegalense]|uniref:hypothetical protein n=1 Tax=Clostridium senegalense TaxID=1465809 RepID=UPI0018FF0A02